MPLIAGAVVSTTSTMNDPDAPLPAWSMAVHCTVVVPRAKVVPLDGVQSAPSGPSTRSLAVAP